MSGEKTENELEHEQDSKRYGREYSWAPSERSVPEENGNDENGNGFINEVFESYDQEGTEHNHSEDFVDYQEGQVVHAQDRQGHHIKHMLGADEEDTKSSNNVFAKLKSFRCKAVNRKWLVIAIIVFVVVATAVTVPTTLLLRKQEDLPPDGEDHWIECPFVNGKPEEVECEKRGCVWRLSASPWPSCHLPTDNNHYKVKNVQRFDRELVLDLQRSSTLNLFGSPREHIKIHVDCNHDHRVTIKITPGEGRNTASYDDQAEFDLASADYLVEYKSAQGEDFHLSVVRKATKDTIWNSSLSGLVAEEGFIQVGSHLSSSYLYGMGQNWHQPSLKRWFDMRTWPLFARSTTSGDSPIDPKDRLNMNSVHPFYLNLEKEGRANGVLFQTTFPSEYILLKSRGIVFRTIEGQLEFTIFIGNSAKHVSELLNELTGGAAIPPIWALGFHIAPLGQPKHIIEKIKKSNIPLDSVHLSPTVWTDEMVFDLNKVIYKDLYDTIGANPEINWLLSLSPGVRASCEYNAYKEGLERSAFIRWPQEHTQELPPGIQPSCGDGKNSNIMFGKRKTDLVVAYFAFHKQDGGALWYHELLKTIRTSLKYNGVITIRNEPFNYRLVSTKSNNTFQFWSLNCSGQIENYPRYPTAAAWGHGEDAALSDDTICMVGLDSDKEHLELHNRYGMDMASLTYQSCSEKERCFVMSHSTSYIINNGTTPGTVAKLLDHVDNSWEGMRRALISVLEFSILGVPLVAADICGSEGSADPALCGSWLQLSTFFPIARTRVLKTDYDQDQEWFPFSISNMAKISLQLRYSLLLYTYSALHTTRTTGEPLARPLFYDFPNDTDVWDLDKQFMYGPSFMVTPVLFKEDAEYQYLNVYFPNETWYRINHDVGMMIEEAAGYSRVYTHADEHVPLFVRGGHIVPFQEGEHTNVDNKLNSPITLRIYPENEIASGFLYVDDGRSIDQNLSSNSFTFEYNKCQLRIERQRSFKSIAFPRSLHVSLIKVHDWHFPAFHEHPGQNTIPLLKTPGGKDFICRPIQNHQVLYVEVDIDLTQEVQNNSWIIDWSTDKSCFCDYNT